MLRCKRHLWQHSAIYSSADIVSLSAPRPEDKAAKKERLLAEASAREEGKEVSPCLQDNPPAMLRETLAAEGCERTPFVLWIA